MSEVDDLRKQMPAFLKNRGIDISKNFHCLNPEHEDNTPSMRYDPETDRVKCFGCQVYWSIFDVIAVEHGAEIVDGEPKYNFKEVVSLTKKALSNPDSHSQDVQPKKQSTDHKRVKTPQKSVQGKIEHNQIDKINQEIIKRSQVVLSAKFDTLSEDDRERLSPFREKAINYLASRGISLKTAQRYKLGYVDAWVSPTASAKGAKPTGTSRIIIPTSQKGYVARDAREEIPAEQQKYKKMKEGRAGFFNGQVLAKSNYIFVVEGEFDALAIEETGLADAVALGSVAMIKKFANTVKGYKQSNKDYYPTFLLALDNDESGQRAQTQLKALLDQAGVTSFTVQIARGSKDANEALTRDKEAFVERVYSVIKDPADRMARLLDFVDAGKEREAIATGLENLDEVLDGGLFEGLYCIGAVSSLGKTTLALQIADYIAQFDRKQVLYFALEMSWQELMLKSISRISYEQTGGDNDLLAQSTRSLLKGDWKQRYNREQYANVMKAYETYGTFQQNIEIHDGAEKRPTAQDIVNTVTNYVGRTGLKPVVVVDYLQILKSANERATDKANITESVNTLKKLSTKYHIPVLLISSFNRSSYGKTVSMDAFKESGEIEYSSDVLIGLQFEGVGIDGFDENQAKNQDIRRIEAVILKNRNGVTGKTLHLAYNPMFNKLVPNEDE